MTGAADTLDFAAPGYRLRVSPDGRWAELSGESGGPLLRLSLVASLDTVTARDETLATEPPRVTRADQPGADWPVITVARRSTCWPAAWLRLACRPDGLQVEAHVRGQGRLGEAHLLGGRSLIPGAQGFLRTGCTLPTLFSPNPEDPRGLLRRASSPAVVGVTGDPLPGRGHWFFTPAPLYLALSRQRVDAAPDAHARGDWLGLGVLGAAAELAQPLVFSSRAAQFARR